jgi:predicted DCC family thiol-disulfide oxidoreductase YuxK
VNQTVLLFDGVCNLCSGFVNFVIKRDRLEKIKFSSLQSPFGQKVSEFYHLPKVDFDTLVFLDEGKYFLRSTAVLKLAKKLGGIWKLFYVLILIPTPIRDFVYKLVSKNRYKIFGKKQTCMVPDKNVETRFITEQ